MLQVYRLCINMLMTAYTAAILVGVLSTTYLYQKIAIVSDILDI
jgi:homogentisate phytyltransferase/homogentisate geranylgeranyltransferase